MTAYAANILSFLGFAPEIWLLETRRERAQDRYQIQTGLYLNMLFAVSLLLILAITILEYFCLRYVPDLNGEEPFFVICDSLSFAPLLVWAVLFISGIFCSVVNRPLRVPFITRAFWNRRFLCIAVAWGFTAQILLLLLVILYLRAAYLTRPHPEPPSVYMLYENALSTPFGVIPVPELVFPLGFYPVAETAAARWGDTSIAVEPLSRASLQRALQNGRMLVIASHGGSRPGSIALKPGDHFDPHDILAVGGAGPDLQFVYLAGCNTGSRREDWQYYLGPVELVTFDRVSWIVEHVYWLWIHAPNVVHKLK